MRKRTTKLPEFARPPLKEVAISVQFEPLKEIRAWHIGEIANLFAAEFPHRSEQPPLTPVFETEGKIRQVPSYQFGLQVQFATLARYWFSRSDQNELIQFQTDRLIHNWRRTPADDVYPRFEVLSKKSMKEFKRLDAYLRKAKLGELTPNQVEITYVNAIDGSDEIHKKNSEVFNFVQNSMLADAFEDMRFVSRYIINSTDGQFMGRLYAQCDPAFDEAGKAILQFQLIARGRPSNPTLEGVIDFLNLGHARIVAAFDSLTTANMHAKWGKS